MSVLIGHDFDFDYTIGRFYREISLEISGYPLEVGRELGVDRAFELIDISILLQNDDISLIGFDDLPSSSYTTPPLTTIRQPLYDTGLIATKALLELINGNRVDVALPALELMVRETTRLLR